MLRVGFVLFLAMLSVRLACATPLGPPGQKERDQAFAALSAAGASLSIRQGGRILGIPPRSTASDYQDIVSAAGVADGQSPACHPVVAASLDDRPPHQATDALVEEISCFRELRRLQIWGGHVTDRGMEHLFVLTNLRELGIERADISDEGLKCLQAMPHIRLVQLAGNSHVSASCFRYLSKARELEGIYIRVGTDIGSGALRYLRGLPSLRRLDLQCARFDEGNLADLKRLPALESLGLVTDGSGITDAGLDHIARLKNLRTLGLGRAKISAQGLARLRALPKLHDLGLGARNLGDEDLGVLATFPALQKLQVDYTKITDAGLKHLYHMKTLKWISLRGTAVTRAGLQALRVARPDLEIWWANGPEFPGRVTAKPPSPSGNGR